MKIALSYRGPIPVQRGNVDIRHAIRKDFSSQLEQFWVEHPVLSLTFSEHRKAEGVLEGNRIKPTKLHGSYAMIEVPASGYRIFPLVCAYNGLTCELTISVWRRADPGFIIERTGDVDATMKVLFDALRMPQSDQECPPALHGSGDERLFCLLEDDSLISQVSIDSQRVLRVPHGPDARQYAEVTIIARPLVLRPHPGTTYGFGSV